ncbi:hypothetical protein [Flavobacterium sp. N1994]|uniref:hypothetical protein n=1 Tax=Flavobacterium sp. N1994 TaxID=2986827 RepID=UPI0022220364|nr:hypothetical protein [Flavobacterium sp. N1994]
MPDCFCEYCGTKNSSIAGLVANPCFRHPNGSNKGKHKLYEGSTKSQYYCKYCGTSDPNISGLTNNPCYRHPNGANKGKHAPAL